MRMVRRILLLLPLMLLFMATAIDADAEENGKCIKCHCNRAIITKGDSHAFIDPVKYAVTTHARIGCVSCHYRVTKRHPDDGIRPSRATCKECHAPVFKEYGESLHGGKAGCVDCHNPHAVKPLLSVSGRDINAQCAKCHGNSKIVASHSKWLPQAALHIDDLPCITCHTGSQNYVITLYIAKKETTVPFSSFNIAKFEDLNRPLSPGEKIETLIDYNGDGLILLSELQKFNKNSKYKNMSIFGTMMPEAITHSYQILENRWDCTFCHVTGAKGLQTSYLALPTSDGTYRRIAVEKGAILDILYGTPDFYMLGTTRSTTLSIIGAIIAAGGLMVPIVHGMIRLLTRKKRKD
ncbi:MAG TPA: cytochrome c3 family protein [Syntrophales bacterium]|nr:cytochrome c3 family protein [Syntrophales bacterium]